MGVGCVGEVSLLRKSVPSSLCLSEGGQGGRSEGGWSEGGGVRGK